MALALAEWLPPVLHRWSGSISSAFQDMAAGAAASCTSRTDFECRDTSEALTLKGIAIAAILVTGGIGVALPLLGSRLRFIRTDGNVFYLAKAVAAGVILATGFVHVLPDAMESLSNECLPEVPWRKFPFAGFIAMLAALCTMLVDFAGTEYFERRHSSSSKEDDAVEEQYDSISLGYPASEQALGRNSGKNMHIVGMRAHASSHRHSHPEGHHSCQDTTHAHSRGHFGHAHTSAEDEFTSIKHVVISQVLELGIITHSVIVGFSLGVSQSPCTIRPLLSALSFHQFFEGFALGGCISQARFKLWATACMAFFFSVTTPAGIAFGIGISRIYNADSAKAVILEGVFNSCSAGILIYMSLVDLIAADFISKRMRCHPRLQVFSYLALFSGALAMSALALWA